MTLPGETNSLYYIPILSFGALQKNDQKWQEIYFEVKWIYQEKNTAEWGLEIKSIHIFRVQQF